MPKSVLIERGVLDGEFDSIEEAGSACTVTKDQDSVRATGKVGAGEGAEAGLALGVDTGFGHWRGRKLLSFAIGSRMGHEKIAVRVYWSEVMTDSRRKLERGRLTLGVVEATPVVRTVFVEVPDELRREEREVLGVEWVVARPEAQFDIELREVQVR